MQLINGTLFLKFNFSSPNVLLFTLLLPSALTFLLLGSSKSAAVNIFLTTVIFPVTKIYASLKSHKSDYNIEVLILIPLFAL